MDDNQAPTIWTPSAYRLLSIWKGFLVDRLARDKQDAARRFAQGHRSNGNYTVDVPRIESMMIIDRPALKLEDIVITPEMIEAGEYQFLKFDSRVEDEKEAVISIYRAMELARQNEN